MVKNCIMINSVVEISILKENKLSFLKCKNPFFKLHLKKSHQN